jgi:signal transduction histidine kinase
MKVSLKSYILILIGVVLFFSSVTASLLLFSNRSAALSTRDLTKAVESVAAAQSIQQNLNIHHRQALLKGLRSHTERKQSLELAKVELLNAEKLISQFTSSSESVEFTREVQKNLMAYFSAFENDRREGLKAIELYESVSEPYYKTQISIQQLIQSNLKETLALQSGIFRQNRLDFFILSLASLFLILALTLLFWGLRRILYLPLIQLKNNIESFELGNLNNIANVRGATEIESISTSFSQLANKLSKQKDMQLNFLSSVAHDLKNPLSAIKMSAEILNRDQASDKAHRMLAIIGRQTGHLQRLIEDLMDTTRIESGHMDLKFEPHDIRKIISDSVELHAQLSTKHKISIQLPPSIVLVQCDPHRLMQVFNNILNNSIKYSPDGGEIVVQVITLQIHVHIHISDTGVGILPQDINRIFEPYRRSSTTKDFIPGVGLGLSVSQKIIRAHKDGEIIVKSQFGIGSTFTIQLRTENFLKAQHEDIFSMNQKDV